MLPNVQQATIAPIITKTVNPGTLIYTDEYDIYARLEDWGYGHKSVCHAWGEYARDDDGDGFCEVHVNTLEGFWSLLRSWLRPHRGISQEKLPIYLGFFQFVHNTRRRGKALLGVSCYQGGNKGAEQGFAALAGIVDELKEAQIDGQLLLRDAAVRAQPGAQQRPEPFQGIDVNFTEAVAILVAGVFAAAMADRSVLVAPGRQAGIDRIFVRVDA